MSNNSSNRVVRALGVPAMALVLASSSMVALAGTAAAKPLPSVTYDLSCSVNDLRPNFEHQLAGDVYPSYKGKWVEAVVSISFDGNHDQTLSGRYDSHVGVAVDTRYFTDTDSSTYKVDVAIYDKKGLVDSDSTTGSCPSS